MSTADAESVSNLQLMAAYNDVIDDPATLAYVQRVESGEHKRWSEINMVCGWYADTLRQAHLQWPAEPRLWRQLAAKVMEVDRGAKAAERPPPQRGFSVRQFFDSVRELHKVWHAQQREAYRAAEVAPAVAERSIPATAPSVQVPANV